MILLTQIRAIVCPTLLFQNSRTTVSSSYEALAVMAFNECWKTSLLKQKSQLSVFPMLIQKPYLRAPCSYMCYFRSNLLLIDKFIIIIFFLNKFITITPDNTIDPNSCNHGQLFVQHNLLFIDKFIIFLNKFITITPDNTIDPNSCNHGQVFVQHTSISE